MLTARMKYWSIPIFFLLLLLTFTGCGTTKPDDYQTDSTPSGDEYIKTDITPKTIKTEYTEYEFKSGETRQIMVFGNDKDAPEAWWEVWTDVTSDFTMTFSATIGKAPNAYRENSGNFNFTVPLNVTAPTIISNKETFTLTIHAGHSSNEPAAQCTVKINVVQARDYKIRYNCMVDYNILDVNNTKSFGTQKTAEEAFSEAGTKLVFSPENTQMEYTTIPIGDLQAYHEQNIENWIFSKIDDGSLSIQKSKSVIFIAASDHNMNQVLTQYVSGMTTAILGLVRAQIRYDYVVSIVFVDRASASTLLSEEEKKKNVTKALVHELSHARTKWDNPNIFPLLTDFTHTIGHNGTYSLKCCLRFYKNDADPKFTEALFKNSLSNIRFCFGHLQRLYNCTLSEE